MEGASEDLQHGTCSHRTNFTSLRSTYTPIYIHTHLYESMQYFTLKQR